MYVPQWFNLFFISVISVAPIAWPDLYAHIWTIAIPCLVFRLRRWVRTSLWGRWWHLASPGQARRRNRARTTATTGRQWRTSARRSTSRRRRRISSVTARLEGMEIDLQLRPFSVHLVYLEGIVRRRTGASAVNNEYLILWGLFGWFDVC